MGLCQVPVGKSFPDTQSVLTLSQGQNLPQWNHIAASSETRIKYCKTLPYSPAERFLT